jgi:hypothetical protein
MGLIVAAGCDHHVCTVECPPAGRLDIGVVNDQTGAPICDATVTATDHAYTEQLVPAGCRYTGAQGRSGIYSVRVERLGFQPKEASNVEIHVRRTDCCGDIADTASLTIRLVPAP